MIPRPTLPPALRPASRRRLAGGAVLLVLLLLVVTVVARSDGQVTVPVVTDAAQGVDLSPTAVTVAVGTTALPQVVPAAAIGLSFDENVLGARGLTTAAGIVPLMRRLGPSILRVGGTTSQWGKAVAWTPEQLHSLDAVLRGSGWRAILTEDDAHFSPAVTRTDARNASSVLGPRLAAMACGNEPDGYRSAGWRPRGYGFPQLAADELRCLRTIHAVAPQVPLVGPDASYGWWLHAWTPLAASSVSVITTHLYPMAACKVPWHQPDSLLGGAAQEQAVADLRPAITAARAAHRPLLLDETNSAACGGIRGLSNAYASALWAPDEVFTLLQAGVVGLDFHGEPDAWGCREYSPICLPAGSSTDRAQPVYDGLLLAHQLGTGPLLPVTGGDDLLRTHAVRRADGRTAVLLDNESHHPVLVHLVVPRSSGAATETLMTDPGGLHALGGVRFTAGSVDAGPVGSGGTSYEIHLPALSAAAVTAATSVAA